MATPACTLAQRIGHTDQAIFRHIVGVHAGPGSMDFGPLLGADALSTNLIFVHRGVIQPRSGIGQHFHNQCEEMFVILDGEAEFTVNGRTASLKGPAGVPDRMGSAHGIYNPTDRPVQWLNINVGMTKRYDTFNLNDDRVGAPIDRVRIHQLQARQVPAETGPGPGRRIRSIQYRRVLEPTVFSTPWTYLDHMLIPPGASVGSAGSHDISEVYYVIAGEGSFTVGKETTAVKEGDAIPVDLDQVRSIRSGSVPLELLVVGVARDLAAKAAWSQAHPAGPAAGR